MAKHLKMADNPDQSLGTSFTRTIKSFHEFYNNCQYSANAKTRYTLWQLRPSVKHIDPLSELVYYIYYPTDLTSHFISTTPSNPRCHPPTEFALRIPVTCRVQFSTRKANDKERKTWLD